MNISVYRPGWRAPALMNMTLFICNFHSRCIQVHSVLNVQERFFNVRYSFLLISNKFCDLSLLHWSVVTAEGGIEMWEGGGGV
jgi:hypothetical protein